MAEVEVIVDWLRESGHREGASLLEQCELSYHWVDLLVEMGGSREYDIVEAEVRAPHRVLQQVNDDRSKIKAELDSAIRDCALAEGVYIRDVRWLPRLRTTDSPADKEIEAILAVMDSAHIREAWRKTLARRRSDPSGAITAARTLIEATCKAILKDLGVEVTGREELPKLYHLVAERLRLAPSQQTDELARRLLGNCQAVVDGVAALRKQLGDAHAPDASAPLPDVLHAELAINLAGAISSFLVGSWDRQKKELYSLRHQADI